MIAVGALVACCLQFFLGKTIGSVYNDRISGGQALGQKNTILAIWMAHTYLNPLSSVAPDPTRCGKILLIRGNCGRRERKGKWNNDCRTL